MKNISHKIYKVARFDDMMYTEDFYLFGLLDFRIGSWSMFNIYKQIIWIKIEHKFDIV
jgi:hypothetical protein